MRITEVHSHLNGYEHIVIHKPHLWEQLEDALQSVPSASSWSSVCAALGSGLASHGWVNPRHSPERAGAFEADECQTDFVKDRIAVEVQMGKYAFVAYDLFVKHMAFFVGDLIDVGVEILPMKELQAQMSSGVPYYEGALYDLMRQGRGVPAVPLVLVGIAP